MERKSSGRTRILAALLAALAPAALLAATPAAVQTVDGDDGKDVYVVHDEVFVEERAPEVPGLSTIAAKLPLSLEETPLAVDGVGIEEIELRDTQVLGDAVENVAGLNVQSGNGIFDAFTLRGMDTSANALILLDGAPEPQSAFFQLYNIERVEVVKGPVSLLYGAAAMGGVINLVRKQPHQDTFTGFSASYGSFATIQGTLDANYAADSDRWGLRLNSQWFQTDNFRDDKDAENFAVNPAFVFRPDEKTTVHFSLEYVDTDARPDSGVPVVFDLFGQSPPAVADMPRRRSYDTPFSRSEQEVYRFQVDVERRFSENFVLRNKTYYRQLDWLSDSTSQDAVIPDISRFNPLDPLSIPLVISRTQLTLDDKQTYTGNQLEALWRVESGSVSHNLLFGLELAQLRDEFTFAVGLLPEIDLLQPVETAQGSFPIFGFGTDAESTVVAPYVVDQIRFSDKFQLLVGLRFDDIDFEDSAIGLERGDSQVSPMIGAVYSPTPSLSFYFNAGEAFSPQSTFVVGESRDPEESQQIEVGLRAGRADGKLEAKLAVYQLDRENVAIPDQTGITQQTGSQRNEGVELEVISRLRRGLTATFTYSWTDAVLTEFTEQSFGFDLATGGVVPFTVDLSGNQAAWVPENIASLWLNQTFRMAGDASWGVAVGGRWVDEQFISENNAFAIDDYFMADAALWYDYSSWRFQFNFDNFTDEETFTRVFAGSSVIPAPGFTVRTGFRYGF